MCGKSGLTTGTIANKLERTYAKGNIHGRNWPHTHILV